MAEYIERKKVLKILEDMRMDYENSDDPIHTLCEDYADALETAENKLNMLIAADVRPERHGEWKINPDGYYPYCSECGKEPKNGVMSKFCPNCGAKMDGRNEKQ